jgi:hypothetical protein
MTQSEATPSSADELEVPYIDTDVDPAFRRNPYTTLLALAGEHTIVAGRDGIYGGVEMPKSFLLPDHDQDMFLALTYETIRSQTLTQDGS